MTPDTIADLDDDRRVWFTSRTGGGEGSARAHLEADCRTLECASVVYDREAGTLDPDMPVCRICTGDVDFGAETGVNPRAMAKRLEAMDADELGSSSTGGAAR